MPRLDKEFKEQIRNLPKNQLEEIVIKFASKSEIYNYLILKYFDKEFGESDLFNETIKDLESLKFKNYKGFSQELRLANLIKAWAKRINEFTKISKNKKLEADLLVFVVDNVFDAFSDMLGTCFTTLDTQLAIQVRKLVNIVTKQLHEDYRIEYHEKINNYLSILHRKSSHIDAVYELPKSI